MAGTLALERLGDMPGQLVEFFIGQLAQGIEFRLYFLQLIECMLALGTAYIIGAGSQAVRLIRIGDDDAGILECNLAVTIVQRVAVEQDGAVLFAHADSKLVHDTAVDANEYILCFLGKLDHLDHVKTETKCFIENNCCQNLKRSRGRQT